MHENDRWHENESRELTAYLCYSWVVHDAQTAVVHPPFSLN
jgi:hypothetical protein